MFACRTILRFCPRETQLWSACGVGARTHLARDFMKRDLVISVALARNRHPRMQNALVDSDRSASDLIQRTQRNFPSSLSSDTLYFFFVLVTKIRKTTRRSLTRPSLTRLMRMMLRRTWTTLGAVVCDCMHARSHLCVGMGGRCSRTLQGEHLPHRTVSQAEHCGGRRGHCTCRRFAGNGSDVWSALVQGLCLLSPANVASHDAVNSWCRRADMEFVLLLLRSSWRATTSRHQDCGGALRTTTVL